MRAGIERTDQCARRLYPRLDDLIAIGIVPAALDIEDVLAGEIDDDIASGQAAFGQIFPGDATRARGARNECDGVAACAQGLCERTADEATTPTNNDMTWALSARI